MSLPEIPDFLHPFAGLLLPAALLVTVLVLGLAAHRVRKIARSERPDEPLSNVAMLLGLGWSSEAVWELTGRANLPVSVRVALFTVLEVILVVSMIRVRRSVRERGTPGRSGQTVWVVASGMALVGLLVAGNLAEGVLRALIPIFLTLTWWEGVVPEGVRRVAGSVTWRWTPRRLLLWLGAIEPGERDVESVHRERLTQQMTQLEFQRRYGSAKRAERRKERLARLTLSADDAIVAEVQARLARISWITPTHDETAPNAAARTVPVGRAASVKAGRVRHRRTIRTLRVTHPGPQVVAVQAPRQDPRETHEVDLVVRAIKTVEPKLPQRQIARLAATSEPTVRRALRRTQNPAPPPTVNGREPDLIGADR